MPSCDCSGTEILQAGQKIVSCLQDKHHATSVRTTMSDLMAPLGTA
jgi:hypothetical protein